MQIYLLHITAIPLSNIRARKDFWEDEQTGNPFQDRNNKYP